MPAVAKIQIVPKLTRAHAIRIAYWISLLSFSLAAACGKAPTAPVQPTTLDQSAVTDALDYWAAAVGTTYVLVNTDALPRLLLRPGTDGLGTVAISRGLIDGTDQNNQALSGLVVILPSVGDRCPSSSLECREIFRHELGHAIGFLDEPPSGLMSSAATTDVLTDREIRMMQALYSLPIGARLQTDGTWTVAATGASGQLDDLNAVQDILTYNVNAKGGAGFRKPGLICRWQLPIPVYFQR